MLDGHTFCALDSRAVSEPLFGTAPHIDIWIALECPWPWPKKLLDSKQLTEKLRSYLSAAQELHKNSRLLFVKRRTQQSCHNRTHLLAFRRKEKCAQSTELTFTCDDECLNLDLDGSFANVRECDGEHFMVCTHGKHDRCCALFGVKVYNSLKLITGTANVWQSSHLGGDRYAGNLAIFPHGIFYGHVDEGSIESIVAIHRKGLIAKKHFRGYCWYPQVVQAAEYFVRTHTDDWRQSSLTSFRYQRISDQRYRVQLVLGPQVFETTIDDVVGEKEVLMDCSATAKVRLAEYRLVNVTSVRADGSSMDTPGLP